MFLNCKKNATMKKILFFYLAFITASFYAQDNRKIPEGWDLITLEGKPAYMNLITGDVSVEFPKYPAKKPTIAKELDPSIFHTVEKGETLFSIARKHNISVDEIYRKNTTLNPKSIKVGQQIIVGYDKSKEGKVVYEVVEDMYTHPSNNDQHYVKRGETLYSISRKHGLTVAKLKQLNNLTSNAIEIGQKLILR